MLVSQELTQTFAALGDPTRFAILSKLQFCEIQLCAVNITNWLIPGKYLTFCDIKCQNFTLRSVRRASAGTTRCSTFNGHLPTA